MNSNVDSSKVNGINKSSEHVGDVASEVFELRKEINTLTGDLRQMRTLKSVAIAAASNAAVTAITVAAGYFTYRGIRALLA